MEVGSTLSIKALSIAKGQLGEVRKNENLAIPANQASSVAQEVPKNDLVIAADQASSVAQEVRKNEDLAIPANQASSVAQEPLESARAASQGKGQRLGMVA